MLNHNSIFSSTYMSKKKVIEKMGRLSLFLFFDSHSKGNGIFDAKKQSKM